MKYLLRPWRITAGILAVAFALSIVAPNAAMAGTTGTIKGTVTSASTGAPLADVKVSASSPSGNASTTTDSHGFYALQGLIPDTYTLSFQASGYEPVSVPGISVFQDNSVTYNQALSKELKTIASVQSAGSSNLVKPNQTTDEYTISGQQLQAVSGGDGLHKTLYQYMQGTPGVTGNGYPAQPRIRGGEVTDLGYEFDGIPIQDRITGFFTTNLSNVGIGNVEVYTGGLSAANAANGTGVINTVVKVGTYPAFGSVNFGVTAPTQNNYTTIEYGGATPDHKYSYYVGYDHVNSKNFYDYGIPTFPTVLLDGFDGPGKVTTTDIVGNFHYRPDAKNDFQFLYQNGLGDFNFNYLLARTGNEPPILTLNPCAGNVASSTSPTGYGGGTAPNGQTCPGGLFFGTPSAGGGNIWHHYSGIGKIQWNHNINDHSFFALRFAENFNQYIFDQNVSDPNVAALENPGAPYNTDPKCPPYPYQVGQPVPVASDGTLCTRDIEDFYGDRRSNMYFGALDYTNDLNAKTTIHLGIGDEHDQNIFSYYLRNYFGAGGAWPLNYLNSNYPTTIPYVYAEGTFRVGRFVLEPGVRYQQEHYAFPNGGATVHAVDPTFSGTFTLDPKNVFRFSYGDTSSFVGSGYVYRQGSGFYNPNQPGASIQPQINHSADFMWEHQFSPSTSLKVGPWYNSTKNYFEFFTPVIGTNPDGTPKFGKSVPGNAGQNHAFGFELALNHVDTHPIGISYWLSATLDNYWTSSGGQAAFINFPEPQNIVNEGILLRNTGDPIFNASLTMDAHSGRFAWLPFIYYQEGEFYNVGRTTSCSVPGVSTGNCVAAGGTVVAPYIYQPEKIAGAYWKVNMTFLEKLGPNQNTRAGVLLTNVFHNNNDVTPCYSGGTGCFPFNGPQSGVVNQTGYIYQQTYNQNPFGVEFFINQKF